MIYIKHIPTEIIIPKTTGATETAIGEIFSNIADGGYSDTISFVAGELIAGGANTSYNNSIDGGISAMINVYFKNVLFGGLSDSNSFVGEVTAGGANPATTGVIWGGNAGTTFRNQLTFCMVNSTTYETISMPFDDVENFIYRIDDFNNEIQTGQWQYFIINGDDVVDSGLCIVGDVEPKSPYQYNAEIKRIVYGK